MRIAKAFDYVDQSVPARLKRYSKLEGECLVWTSAKTNTGYGLLNVDGVARLAHRLSYREAYGNFHQELDVLHHCDNPPCIKPEHLFLGTSKTNALDAASKGRLRCGERHRSAKLTEVDIREIRKMGDEQTAEAISKKFPVNAPCIRKILQGIRWKHVK